MSEPSARAVLNHLIESCKDGAHGFDHAAELVADPALKVLFADLARTHAAVAAELVPQAQRLGGTAAADGTAAASLHRRWMDARSRMSGHDDRTVLAEAHRGDTFTMAAFKDALDGALPSSVRDVVEQQYSRLRGGHDDLERVRAEGL